MSTRRLQIVLIAVSSWLLGAVDGARAHPLDPALLELWESADGTVEVLWRAPLGQPADAPLQPVLPDHCAPLSAPNVSQSERNLTQRWKLDCGPQKLVGGRVGVDRLGERRTDALLRIHLDDNRLFQTVLRGDAPVVTVPEHRGAFDVLRGYLALGFEHILTRPDHLLFVLGLVLLVPGRRRLLWTITAFTLGHSVTLSVAALGFVHIAPAPVEALIALTIFTVAVELTRSAEGRASWVRRFPWVMAFAFGLLHGLGFAGALAQVGLPAGQIPLALFSFNVGIELGQLLFVGLVLAARLALRALPVRWLRAAESLPAYAIGSLAVFWVLQRITAIF